MRCMPNAASKSGISRSASASGNLTENSPFPPVVSIDRALSPHGASTKLIQSLWAQHAAAKSSIY